MLSDSLITRPIDRADLTLVGALVTGPDLPDPESPHLSRLEDDEPGVGDEDLGVHGQDVPVPPPDPGHRPVGHQLHPALQEGGGPGLRIGKPISDRVFRKTIISL